jgi:NAD(P)H-flavin reductase
MYRLLHHYVPRLARIIGIVDESDDTRTFVLRPEPAYAPLATAVPGQFIMLSVWGHGEAAFSLSRLARRGDPLQAIEVTVRRVGELTTALFALPLGATIGVRGPFGNGFPLDAASVPTVYVAGGCGLSPLKAAIDWQLTRRPPGTPLAIVYGAREPQSQIHTTALERWRATANVRLIECVEHADRTWKGREGTVADYIAEAVTAVGTRRAAVCGPPAMLVAAAEHLRGAGVDPRAIFIAVERYMKCGVGQCGHCYIGHRYVCTDGPVFAYAELAELAPDAFHLIPNTSKQEGLVHETDSAHSRGLGLF